MTDEYREGYASGWQEASDFIDANEFGVPWSALPDDEEDPPNNDFERGHAAGWSKRLAHEGWPTSRRNVEAGS
jgi:hypothetical protein